MIYHRYKSGFTLVELMIAMSLFSFIMLFAVTTFIQVNKIYVKGVTSKRMYDQAQAILADLSTTIPRETSLSQCSTTGDTPCVYDSSASALCLPNVGVSYTWNGQPGSLKKSSGNVCTSDPGTPLQQPQSLIDGNTRVVQLDIKPLPVGGTATNAYSIDLTLSTQNPDQLDIDEANPANTHCIGSISDQYCGVVHLSTIIRAGN